MECHISFFPGLPFGTSEFLPKSLDSFFCMPLLEPWGGTIILQGLNQKQFLPAVFHVFPM